MHTPGIEAQRKAAAAGWLARHARTVVAGIAIMAMLPFEAVVLSAPGARPVLGSIGMAQADDDDGDGDDDGGGGAAAGGGSDSGGGMDHEPFEPVGRVDAETFIADELLALNPSAAALGRATALGARIIERIDAASLPLRVVRLRLPPGLDARSARQILAERDRATFELHHLYKLAQQTADTSPCGGAACGALRLIGWPDDASNCGRNQAIGIVDTAVAVAHPALAGASLRTREFVDAGSVPAAADHGTAVAALLVGRPGSGFPGMVPHAQLFAANPFYTLPSGNGAASTVGLVQSLDWLVRERVGVIGLSLAGPSNSVLEAAVARVAAKGVVVAAAAGNGGQNAPPAYPAAFSGVLSVTAVSEDRRIYWRANRGDYIDYALPGVNVWTVGLAGEGKRRSGTSFAVPFMVGLASQSLAQRALGRDQLLKGELAALTDLGAPGRDPVFGWGKPRFGGICH